ncbi:hypothetical protein [Xanthomonas rydalmerensis]|uniref:Uncharacterized protein n=1 Tax=Xanthomonas rydalmerensis TaxID=3046274 RepID=A0ABZ0JLJ1_9XANT|nr:hypothetical protein [Xanthomonas sp. DM-2023]WOS40688.1 hypothetical protein QN243_20220 [Xanthomonas sp. DM-2023]WOS44872.1 hypothetical protein QN242_20220 [Xanthomonas sp. DM-2023]WOS49052.1 hypothetical protein QN240_20220 [Xanthomonas sp. DM-2023]WOS53232.1 hypothetical protein QN244_20225 [Xanthomonas sp. DM-2023]WOS57415.1 hypothetical protein QN245_20220 [Xanthomonas sp. DM-2023]
MAQTVILAAGQSAASSSTITVASGGVASLSIHAPAGQPIPKNISLPVIMVIDGTDTAVASLNYINPVVPVGVPGVFRVDRPNITAYGTNITVVADQ